MLQENSQEEDSNGNAKCCSRTVLTRIVTSTAFDVVIGILIVFNMVVIIVETDASAKGLAPVWIELVGWTMLLIFVVELSVRLYAFQRSFWHEAANVLDFIIVITDVTFSLLQLSFGRVFPASVLRVFRLGKLARISKILRVCPELRLMMAGLIGSLMSIFWGAILLGFFLLVWSIVAVQFIHPLNVSLAEQGLYADCERCPRAYSSVLESTLTFCQTIVAGDSWGESTIPIIEHYPATAFYFIAVFLSVGIAILNLILGVVVSVAQQEHDRLKQVMESEKRTKNLEASAHLSCICKEMDIDGSGALCKEEFLSAYNNRADLRSCFSALNLQEDDIPIVWTMIDPANAGEVSYSNFVQEVYKLQHKDENFMMQYLKYYINNIYNALLNRMDTHHHEIIALEQSEMEMLRQITPPSDHHDSDGPVPRIGDQGKQADANGSTPMPVQKCDHIVFGDHVAPFESPYEAWQHWIQCDANPPFNADAGDGQQLEKLNESEGTQESWGSLSTTARTCQHPAGNGSGEARQVPSRRFHASDFPPSSKLSKAAETLSPLRYGSSEAEAPLSASINL